MSQNIYVGTDRILAMADELDRRNRVKADYVIPEHMPISLKEDGTGGYFRAESRGDFATPALSLANGDTQRFDITNHCHSQIAGKLNIPKKYYDRMAQCAPDLWERNVNHWLEHNDKKMLLRTLDGTARAFLSGKYRPLDNYDMFKAVYPALRSAAPGIEVKEAALTESRFHLRVVFPSLAGAVKVGDDVQFGISISNSEVGCGKYTLSRFVYRLICDNGMVRSEALSRVHLGGSLGGDDDDVREVFTDETREANDRALFLKTGDIARALLTHESIGEELAVLQKAAGTPVEGHPEKIIELVGKKYDMTQDETTGALRSLMEGGDLSQWGLANAVTAQGHKATDFDRKVELEKAGSQIIELPANTFAA